MKIGRNDPCSCGSGKKHKKCCLHKQSQVDLKKYRTAPSPEFNPPVIVDLQIEPFNEGLSLEKKLMSYVKSNHSDFIKDSEEQMQTLLYRLVFRGYDIKIVKSCLKLAREPFIIPWALYNFVPDLFDQLEKDETEKNIKDSTIAIEFNQQKDNGLSSSETELLNNLNATYFSFYKVKKIGSDGYITIENLLFDIEHRVFDKLLIKNLSDGSIIYARVIHHKDEDVIYGIWPMLIPPAYLGRVMSFKRQCIELNNNQALISYLFRTRFEFDSRDILSLIIVSMIEGEGSSINGIVN